MNLQEGRALAGFFREQHDKSPLAPLFDLAQGMLFQRGESISKGDVISPVLIRFKTTNGGDFFEGQNTE